MKRLFTVLVVIAALVLVVGFYRGWFSMNKDKIKEDEQRAIEKAKDVGGKIREGVRKEAGKARGGTDK